MASDVRKYLLRDKNPKIIDKATTSNESFLT